MTTTRAIEPSKVAAGSTYLASCSYSDSTPDDAANSTTRLSSLTIGHQPGLQSIEVMWSNGARSKHGSGGKTSNTFELKENERITMVMVFNSYIPGSELQGLSIETNFRRKQQFGSDNGGCCKYDVFEEVSSDKAPRMGLFAFRLYLSDRGIFGLSPVWTETLPIAPTVKYERILPHPGDPSRDTPGPVADSAFTNLLMSPIVTLCVGPGGKTFYVHEATLYKLPFFRAALGGLFSESGLRAVTLPEDDPATVSVLVEFLSTGVYTYTFHGDSTSPPLPTPGREEAGFHSAVYMVADKYECAPLAAAAMENLRNVMKGVSGSELVRVWIAGYEVGLRVLEQGDGNTQGLDSMVLKTVKEMLDEDEGEIDRAVREVPDFGIDLLKIALREAGKD